MRNPPLYFFKLIKELNNTNITKKLKYPNIYEIFCIFCSGGGTRTHDLQVSTEYESRTHFIIKWMANPNANSVNSSQWVTLSWAWWATNCSTPQCLAMMGGVEPPFLIRQLLWRITFLFLHLISSRGASIPLPCHIIVFICLLCLLKKTRFKESN